MNLPSQDADLIKKVEILSDTPGAGDTTIYRGSAKAGEATSAKSWRIFKITIISGVTTKTLADGDLMFDNIWDNRTSLSYS